MRERPEPKPCLFVGSSRKDLKRFPAKMRAKKGIATPLQDIELVRSRLRDAEGHYRESINNEGRKS